MSFLRQDLFDSWHGLCPDIPVKGGLTKAQNVTVEAGGAYLETRNPTVSAISNVCCSSSRGFDSIYELAKADGTKYLLLDSRYTSVTDFTKISGAENTSTTNDLSFDSLSVIASGLSIGGNISYCTARGRAFRADGTNPNLVIKDLNTYGTNGMDEPDPCTASSTTGGDIVPGIYKLYVVDVKKDGKYIHRSNPSTACSVSIAGTAISVTLTATSGTDVTHKRVYRTLYGAPDGNAYCAGEWVNTGATVTLTAADSMISTLTGVDMIDISGGNAYLYGKPPLADFVIYAQERMFYGVSSESRLYYSEIGYPESVGTTSYTTPMDHEDGNALVGGVDLQNSLLIFKERKTFIVDLLSEAFPATRVSSRLGCIDSRTIKATGSANSAMWLSHEGVQVFSNGETANVSKGIFKTILRPYMLAGAEFIAEYYGDRNQYHLMMFYRNSAGTEISAFRHIVYSIDSGEWTEFYDRVAVGGTYSQLAEVAAGIATDSVGKQVLVTASLTFGGTTVNLKQWDVDAVTVGASAYRPATDVTGTLKGMSVPDSDGNAYFLYDTGSGFPLYTVSSTSDDGSATEGVDVWDDIVATFSDYSTWYFFEDSGSHTVPGRYYYGPMMGMDTDDVLWITSFAENGSPGDTCVHFLSKYKYGVFQSCEIITEEQCMNIDEIEGMPDNKMYGCSDAAFYTDSSFAELLPGSIEASNGYTYFCDGLVEGSTADGDMSIDITSEGGYTVSIDVEDEMSDTYCLLSPIAIYTDGTYDYVWSWCHSNAGEAIQYELLIFKFYSDLRIDVTREVMIDNYWAGLDFDWNDPEFHIHTTFDYHNAPHLRKNMQKIQLPIEATEPMAALVYVQPDFTEQVRIGITDDTEYDRYGLSPIAHEGETTVDTNDVFDSVEQVRVEALGYNVVGKAFRVAMQGGPVRFSGRMKIHPPIYHLRYLGQMDRDVRG